jgi:hypothetical protein
MAQKYTKSYASSVNGLPFGLRVLNLQLKSVKLVLNGFMTALLYSSNAV